MSRFIATQGSYFEPYSYEELVKPLQNMAEAHRAAEEQADSYAMQAGAIASMLDDSSPKFKALYDSYINNLNAFSDDLYQNGYNARSSKMLSDLRKMYGRDITKINAAITQKSKAVEKYDEDLKKDKTLITDRDPRTLSLDEWYDNPYAGNYNSYSGTMLTAKASAIGENLKRDMRENGDVWKRILGNQYFERNEFTGFHSHEINEAIRNIINGGAPSSERVKVLQTAMQNVYDSSGMSAWATPEQRAQAFSYIGDGIYSAIGENKSTIQQDRSYTSPYQLATLAAKTAKTGSAGALGPGIANLRGASINGIADKKQSKDFVDKTNVFNALSIINELKKSGALRQPNGTLSDAASEAMMLLYDSPYYKELSKGQKGYLSDANLDEVLAQLGNELNKAVTNDHDYVLNITPQAASNMARNVFKLNIGQLHGKQGDAVAASVARYKSGKAVTGNELLSILDSDNLAVGFDAQRGKITVQRTGAEGKEDIGKYDDSVVYLEPSTVLAGTSGFVNASALHYAFDSALPADISPAEKAEMENRIAAMTTVGQTIDLRNLAELIKASYDPMVVRGDKDDKVVFNALVEAFAQGMYDSSNTAWSPNNYREGWGAKTGGDYTVEDYSDLYDEE